MDLWCIWVYLGKKSHPRLYIRVLYSYIILYEYCGQYSYTSIVVAKYNVKWSLDAASSSFCFFGFHLILQWIAISPIGIDWIEGPYSNHRSCNSNCTIQYISYRFSGNLASQVSCFFNFRRRLLDRCSNPSAVEFALSWSSSWSSNSVRLFDEQTTSVSFSCFSTTEIVSSWFIFLLI